MLAATAAFQRAVTPRAGLHNRTSRLLVAADGERQAG